jgi:5-methylcytosine-specific restriction endonuclease McrA
MPRNPYPGHKITNPCNDVNYFETRNKFCSIYNDTKLNNLEKPLEQGSLDMTKVELMIEEYNVSPSFLRFKNRIVIGDLNNTWYIVDGQHRIEMAKLLYETRQVEDELIFCWYKCRTEDDMRLLFNSINQDSTKNQFYIQQSNFDQLIINEFIKSLKTFYKGAFAKKKTSMGKIKTIEEFRDDLIHSGFFKNKGSTQILLDMLKQLNTEFYTIARFGIEYQENPDNYYKDELKHIKEGTIFSLKQTNFIEWMTDKTKDPIHRHKKGKKRIGKKLRDSCWIQEFGKADRQTCPISTCSHIITKHDTDTWHAGHVISEYNGGDTHISNLRPLCKECNLDMSSMNWIDYDN